MAPNSRQTGIISASTNKSKLCLSLILYLIYPENFYIKFDEIIMISWIFLNYPDGMI